MNRAGTTNRIGKKTRGEGNGQGERSRDRTRRDRIAPVEPIPYEEYARLIAESRRRYGFAGDWYVLAAVGKIESNFNGEDMGLAGASRPDGKFVRRPGARMVDGDGDGGGQYYDPMTLSPRRRILKAATLLSTRHSSPTTGPGGMSKRCWRLPRTTGVSTATTPVARI